MRKELSISLMLLCCALCASLALGQTSQSTLLFEAAKPLERLQVPYPSRLVRIGAEARVTVSFMVSAGGDVFEPTVVESYGSELFKSATLRAISESKFEPATFDGEPVESAGFRTINFAIPGGGFGTRTRFENNYYSFMEGIAAGNREQGEELLHEFESLGAHNHFEAANLNLARYRFAELHGPMVDQKHFLNAALIRTTRPDKDEEIFYFEEGFIEPLLKRLAAIQVESKDYRPALNTINRLVAYSPSVSRNEYQELIQQILGIRNDESSYAMSENIPQSGRRLVLLHKGGFYFDRLDGDLAEIKLRCEQKYLFFVFDIESSYEIPESYGLCRLEVIGDPGTTFDLVQY